MVATQPGLLLSAPRCTGDMHDKKTFWQSQNKSMTGTTNFKCCSNLFVAILLLNIVVIITAAYILVVYHLNRETWNGSVQPAPVATGLTNWTTKTGGLFARKKKVMIFVGIMSAPRLISRRNALRKSWLTQCIGIPCLFFSDSQDMYGNKLPDNIYMPLQQEQLLHKDLILAQSPGGINFALRYLWILNWANARYQFEYFLRIDDDYFVCMDRLLLELPHRSREKLYWGYVHCSPPGIKTVYILQSTVISFIGNSSTISPLAVF